MPGMTKRLSASGIVVLVAAISISVFVGSSARYHQKPFPKLSAMSHGGWSHPLRFQRSQKPTSGAPRGTKLTPPPATKQPQPVAKQPESSIRSLFQPKLVMNNLINGKLWDRNNGVGYPEGNPQALDTSKEERKLKQSMGKGMWPAIFAVVGMVFGVILWRARVRRPKVSFLSQEPGYRTLGTSDQASWYTLDTSDPILRNAFPPWTPVIGAAQTTGYADYANVSAIREGLGSGSSYGYGVGKVMAILEKTHPRVVMHEGKSSAPVIVNMNSNTDGLGVPALAMFSMSVSYDVLDEEKEQDEDEDEDTGSFPSLTQSEMGSDDSFHAMSPSTIESHGIMALDGIPSLMACNSRMGPSKDLNEKEPMQLHIQGVTSYWGDDGSPLSQMKRTDRVTNFCERLLEVTGGRVHATNPFLEDHYGYQPQVAQISTADVELV